MNANKTETSFSRRPMLPALLALTVAAIAPATSWAGKREERPVRQVAMSSGAAAPASVNALVARDAEDKAFAVVRRHVDALQVCYRHMPDGAKLELSFTVGPKGRATDIRVEAPALKGTSVPGCVSAAVARWPFPASVGARVSFPLLFVHD